MNLYSSQLVQVLGCELNKRWLLLVLFPSDDYYADYMYPCEDCDHYNALSGECINVGCSLMYKPSYRQLDYIKMLLWDALYFDKVKTFPSNIDQLRSQYKVLSSNMTYHQASALIDSLKEVITVEYTFLCHRKKQISLFDSGCYHMLGALEACIHECEWCSAPPCDDWSRLREQGFLPYEGC